MKGGFVLPLVLVGVFSLLIGVVIVGVQSLSNKTSLKTVAQSSVGSHVVWTSEAKKYSQLLTSDDTLYALSSDGYIFAIDPSSGKEKWNTKIKGSIEYSFYLYKDYIYYVSLPENHLDPPSSPRTLFAINNKTGEEVWTRQVQSYVRKLNITDNILYYTVRKEKKLFALNSTTGDPLWNFDLGMDGSAGNRPESSEGITLIGSTTGKTDTLFALDSNSGNVLWSTPEALSSVVATQILISNGTVYLNTTDYTPVWSEDDSLHALDLKTGKEKWKAKVEGNPGGSLSASQGKVFIAKYYGYVYAFDETTGNKLWRIRVKNGSNYIKSSPNSLFLVEYNDGAGGAPYFGNLSAIDVITGKKSWEYKEDFTTFSDLAYLNDFVFVISSRDGKIIALR